MASSSRLKSLLGSLLILQFMGNGMVVSADDEKDKNPKTQGAAPALPTFGDVVPIAGGMARTDQDFQDGFVIDVFSPKARTVVVTQNAEPLQAKFISGTDGQNFVSLSNYSYVVRTNDSANDMIAKIEIPYRPAMLSTMNIPQANTFVATLSPNGRSWVIDDSTRNVHSSQNNTRIMKMTSIDGEYILVGRQAVDTANIFMQFGQGQTRTVHLSNGPGMQQSEWIDGIRFNVQAEQTMAFNVDLRPGINPGTLPANTQALNSYAWVVNSSSAFGKIDCTMSVPFNRAMLQAMRPYGFSPSTMLTVYKRPLNATSGQFLPLLADNQVVRELPEDRIEISKMTQLDGVYVILVTAPKPVGETGILPTILGGAGGAMEVKTEKVVVSGVEMKGGMKKRGMMKRFLRSYD